MTTTAKIGITLVIILVIVMMGWIWFDDSLKNEETVQNDAVLVEDTIPEPEPEPEPNTAGLGLSDQSDTTTGAIQNDIDAVDKELDRVNVDASTADKAITEETAAVNAAR